MPITRVVLLIISHGVAIALGFALGIYALPILTAPDSPTVEQVQTVAAQATYRSEFVKDLQDSDALHWGEGTVTISPTTITFMGELAPGPDYKLYLAPAFVETEADFNRMKPAMQVVGDIKTFDNFLVNVPDSISVSDFNTVVIWCESFGQFITAAQYQ